MPRFSKLNCFRDTPLLRILDYLTSKLWFGAKIAIFREFSRSPLRMQRKRGLMVAGADFELGF
jgi:hypothetical protein